MVKSEAVQISLFELAREEAGDRGRWAEESLDGCVAVEPPPLPASSSLRLAILGSGSRGNCVVVESAGRRVLVDAGFSCREIERRLQAVDVDPGSLEAVLITHEHGDHCRGALRLSKRHCMPVFATAGTLNSRPLSRMEGVREVRSGLSFEVAGFRVEPFAVPHDAREPVGFVLEDEDGFRVGIAADLGSRSQLAWGRLRDLSVLILEANHDLEMLRSGPYPWALKQRVAGRCGHLSNEEAASGLLDLVNDRLRSVVLYHLSETNNLPELAHSVVGEALERTGCCADMVVASQDQPTDWIELGDDPGG